MSGVAALAVVSAGLALLGVNAAITVARTFFEATAGAGTDRSRNGELSDELKQLFDDQTPVLANLAVLEVLCLCGSTGMIAIIAFDFGGPAIAVLAVVVLMAGAFALTVGVPRAWVLADPHRAGGVAAATSRLALRIPGLALLAAVGAHLGRRVIGTTAPSGDGASDQPSTPHEESSGTADLRASIEDFAEMAARQAMVPRTDMVFVDADFRIDDALQVALLHGYSRLPILGDDRDDIVGVVFAKDLMKRSVDGEGAKSLSLVLHEPWFVPETKKLEELLREMQATKSHLAVVVDEYGGTAGLVTLEDVLEELVGDIVDEFDDEDDDIVAISDTRYRINARAPVVEVNEALDVDLPTGDWTTIGGLTFHQFGRVPVLGEQIDIGECSVQVISLAKRRIVGLILEIPETLDDESDADDPAVSSNGSPESSGHEDAPMPNPTSITATTEVSRHRSTDGQRTA